MKESEGNTEAVRSLKHYGFGAYKLSDVRGARFTETKPCDIIAQSPKGRYIAIEGKVMNEWSNFNDKWLRPNQAIALDDACINRPGRAFIFLYVRIKANKAKKTKRVSKLLVLDWNTYRETLQGKGIGVDQMRAQSVGVWLDIQKDDEGKNIYNLKKLMSFK